MTTKRYGVKLTNDERLVLKSYARKKGITRESDALRMILREIAEQYGFKMPADEPKSGPIDPRTGKEIQF